MPDPISWSQDLPYFTIGFLIAYLLGSIPFGLLLTRFSGAGDIRKLGSGNIGATNVLRTGRKGLAARNTRIRRSKRSGRSPYRQIFWAGPGRHHHLGRGARAPFPHLAQIQGR